MDAPLCQICDPPRRHWKSEPHRFAGKGRGAPGEVPQQRSGSRPGDYRAPGVPPEPGRVAREVKRGGAGLIAPPGQCAFCDRRRAKNTDAMRKRRGAAKREGS